MWCKCYNLNSNGDLEGYPLQFMYQQIEDLVLKIIPMSACVGTETRKYVQAGKIRPQSECQRPLHFTLPFTTQKTRFCHAIESHDFVEGSLEISTAILAADASPPS
jgi:hypothetical protein